MKRTTNFAILSKALLCVIAIIFATMTPLKAHAVANGSLKWVFPIDGTGSTPAIAVDGSIYLTAELVDNDLLFAINPDGTHKWTFDCEGFCDFSNAGELPPVVDADGTIYIATYSRFYALNPDGSIKWSFVPQGSPEQFARPHAAIAEDGTIYINGQLAFHALNPDGSLKWSFSDNDSYYGPPAIGPDGTIYFSTSSTLYALNPDGSEEWEYSAGLGGVFGASVGSGPVIDSDGTIYLTDPDTFSMLAINPNGTKKWRYTDIPLSGFGFNRILSSAAIGADGAIYAGSQYATLVIINPDGTLQKTVEASQDLLSSVTASPAIGANGVIYASNDAGLSAISPEGQLNWFLPISHDSSVAIGADGTIYLSSNGLYAINSNSGGLSGSAWPMLGQNPQHSSRLDWTEGEIPAPPETSYVIDDVTITAQWTTSTGADGYILSFLPYPYDPKDRIYSVNLGAQTSITFELWDGAAYYYAIQAYNDNGTSDYSNVEYFIMGEP
ncbi:MAG: PQQ-binding-like beta-propeller repeat protein [Desulfuromonadales bacterium]|nr:PQQ-binding-like beta-propeller repeat protein [Desulfuromonadales bacterium]